ncbi:MAG: single-stranded DNA-binding protein, partial [Clostridiaceae bacterium]|nr:single-stranded DNA-binding protein [Clostridiaceae bacterium]
AVDRRFKNQHGERETDFIPIVAWRQTAEFVTRYFNKGARIALVGSIQPRSWDDENGVRHYRTEVIADEVYFADSKRQSDDSNQSTYSPNRQTSTARSEIPQGEGFMPDTDETSLPFDL